MSTPKNKGLTTRRSLSAALVLWALLATIIVVAAGLVTLWQVPATTAGGPELAPKRQADILETAPQLALRDYMAEKQALLQNYRWVDKEEGIVALPLDVAMQYATPTALQSQSGPQLEPERRPEPRSEPRSEAPKEAPPTAEFQQNLGAPLPLDLPFRDQHGKPRQLQDFFQDQPVILVLGYYQCPRLCSTVMTGVLQTIQNIDLPYQLVTVSIDPRETPEIASRQYAFYTGENSGKQLHMLTGEKPAIADLTARAGFGWEYDEESDQYSHPAGFLIATPDGKVSRYFPGVRFDLRDVRLSLIEASEERIGTLAERIILMCSHYDPLQGRYTVTVMALLRIMAILLLAALAFGLWFLHSRRRRQ